MADEEDVVFEVYISAIILLFISCNIWMHIECKSGRVKTISIPGSRRMQSDSCLLTRDESRAALQESCGSQKLRRIPLTHTVSVTDTLSDSHTLSRTSTVQIVSHSTC